MNININYVSTPNNQHQQQHQHQQQQSTSTIVSTLSASIFALVSTVNNFQQYIQFNSAIRPVFCTNFEPKPLFSARISNSASTAAPTTVSCLNSEHARLLLRQPTGIGIALHLNLAGQLFVEDFFRSPLLTKKTFLTNKHINMGPCRTL